MTYTDIRKTNWIEWFPEKIHPFFYIMRLDRPIGTWLLLLPALWAIILAGGMTTQTCVLGILFAIGAVIMRGAGCVVNDLWDRDLDKKVERTASRPLASGVMSVPQALIFLIFLLLCGLIILLQMNGLTIILGIVSLLLVGFYPLMKRITWWPQAFLGLTFNLGALMGWSAVVGEVSMPAVLLYVGGFFWTMGYDTIYAHQDTKDDELIGIKSTARLFGKYSQRWVASFYIVSSVCLMSAVFMMVGWRGGLCLPAFIVLYMQIKTFDDNNQKGCLINFKRNRDFGLLFLLGCLFAV